MTLFKGLRAPPRLLDGLLAAVIWSSTFVIIKLGLTHVGPLTLSSIRFLLAAAVLLPRILIRGGYEGGLPARLWVRLLAIGIAGYAIGNGALAWSLQHVPAATASLVLGLEPILILFLAPILLREIPNNQQRLGTLVAFLGTALFFSSMESGGGLLGAIALIVAILGILVFDLLARDTVKRALVPRSMIPSIPLAAGGVVLLVFAALIEGVPNLSVTGWLLLLWLGLVNTALANFLYFRAISGLSALQMNVLVSLSPMLTVLLAWVFLGEGLSILQLGGMAVATAGVLLVNVQRPSG